MGYFLIAVGVLVVGIVVLIVATDWDLMGVEFIAIAMIVIAGLAVLIMGIGMIIENANPEAKYVDHIECRKTIEYYLDSELYKNDNNMNSYEIFDTVGNYNRRILSAQEYRKSWMTRAFYGKYYDWLEPIDLSQYDFSGGIVE